MEGKEGRTFGRNYVLVNMEEGPSAITREFPEIYPGYGEKNFYVLRSGVKEYMKEELAGYLERAGYTEQDYQQDREESGVGEGENTEAWFRIPLSYRLEEENLVVSVNPAAVEYNRKNFYLVDMDILPYFGAQSHEDGYLFVPDGSGALIYMNNGKTSATPYYAMVYGQDESRRVLDSSRSEIEASAAVKLPVFGLKAGDQALFAIIEEGAGYADISASVGGTVTTYNHVYAGFSYLPYGPASLGDMLGGASNSYQLYGEETFTGTWQIRYAFLTDGAADYSGMAAYYRGYLEETGALSRQKTGEKTPLYVELIGAIDKYKTFLGVKYKATQPLTTFAQAEEIVDVLARMGVDRQTLICSGWADGGLHGRAATSLRAEGSLDKGGVSVRRLQEDMAARGVDTFMTVDMQYVWRDTWMDGYSPLQYGPGYFDHSNITVDSYYQADGSRKEKLADLISPYYAGQIGDRLAKVSRRYDFSGINLGSASWFLYSDYLEEQYTDRQKAMELYGESFQALGEAAGKLMGDNGNAYCFPYVDAMINVPLYSNGYQILDQDVPFYEMVLHGYVPYAGEALNLADDYQTTLLKSVESGAGLHYEWIYGENSLLKETEYDYLYSVNYEGWAEQAAEDYGRAARAMEGLEDQVIVKHEIPVKNTGKTIYEDGSAVYVNYGTEPVEIDGITVPARDFAVRKGGD